MKINRATACIPVESWTPAPPIPRQRHLHLVESAPQPALDQQWLERLTQAVVEILAGRRPATSMTRIFSASVLSTLRSQTPLERLRDGRTIAVRSQTLGQDSVEVAAVVACRERTRALTMRLNRRHERWRVVSVAVL